MAIDIQATTDDQQWFTEHPEATYRVRDYIPGELADYIPPSHCRILVQRVGSLLATSAVTASIWQNVPLLAITKVEDQHV